MGIYYINVNVISRSSGRSAVGAAAYRAGEKLRSAASSAAYRSGDKIRDEKDEMVHDYRNKSDVIYSEIMLPKNAPPQYKDRETLWRAVEASERRKDAQLAREIVVALQREFSLQERLDVLREYVQENFVEKGMCVDLNVHDKGDGNPHAHIMLTTRNVAPEGFKGKNRDWNSRSELLSWRKSWADCNNRMFERKGLDERVDHRSYKEQGLDKEPMIHLGHEAWALEKKGIRTAKGDYNRAVQRRNEERAALKEAGRLTQAQQQREVVKAAEYAEKAQKQHEAAQNAKKVEGQLRAAKATLLVEQMRERQEIAQHMNELKTSYAELDKEQAALKAELNDDRRESYQLVYRAERMDEQAKTIADIQSKAIQLQQARQGLSIWSGKKKKELNDKLRQAEREAGQAQGFFLKHFHIMPDQAAEEIKRTQKAIREKETEIRTKETRLQEIIKQQNTILLQYQTRKLLNDTRPDKENIERQLESLKKTPESVHDKLQQQQHETRLNTISDENFLKIINNLPQSQAHDLVKLRQQAKEQEKSVLLSKTMDKDRNERSR